MALAGKLQWVVALVAIAAATVGVAASSGAGAGTAAARAGSGTGGVMLRDLGDFEAPVYAAAAPGRRNRDLLFVVEQGGTIRVLRDGRELARPFLDISSRISNTGERGLLSIAFDPRYARNRRFYLYYTGLNGDIRVSQMRRSLGRNVVAEPGSMRKVIQIPHRENSNHNGGQVAFGPDGNLWLGTGDGGSACDPPANAQSSSSLLGKLLRIKPRRHGGYSIPKDNPFRGRPGADEIYALGLRNPFRFSFDEATRTIAIGDVGQGSQEEVDYETLRGARGKNFGWNYWEGFARSGCPSSPPAPPANNELPIFSYLHSGGGFTGCSITGGLVVRDRRLPTLRGRYLYSDFCNGQLRSLIPEKGQATDDRPLGPTMPTPTSFTEGRRHRIYATSLEGDVYRLVPAGGGAPAASSASPGGARRAGGGPGDGRGGFRAAAIGTFDQPVYVTGPKGANGLLFVVEQDGVIRLVKNGRKLGGRPFLDIRKRVQSGGERGLLSVAFSPGYRRNGRLYVYFTDGTGDIVVQEYRRSRANPRRAREGSARTVIRVRHRANANHNGGQLQFGPDGNLFIGTGDGGAEGDPPENAQSKGSLLGKLIRIDPRRQGKRPYTVPKSNPFVGRDGRNEIYALGLRNPFRFSFDRRTGNLAIGDVGQERYEEVDLETLKGARKANFGWDAFEGKHRYDSADASPPPKDPAFPVFEYSHAGGACSITGGYVSRDRRIASLRGRYLYADLCEGQIRSFVPRLSGARDDRGTGLPSQSGIASFGEDARGHLYFANLFSGKVFAIQPLRSGRAPSSASDLARSR